RTLSQLSKCRHVRQTRIPPIVPTVSGAGEPCPISISPPSLTLSQLGQNMFHRRRDDRDELRFAQSPRRLGADQVATRSERNPGGLCSLKGQPGYFQSGAQHFEKRGSIGLFDAAHMLFDALFQVGSSFVYSLRIEREMRGLATAQRVAAHE